MIIGFGYSIPQVAARRGGSGGGGGSAPITIDMSKWADGLPVGDLGTDITSGLNIWFDGLPVGFIT